MKYFIFIWCFGLSQTFAQRKFNLDEALLLGGSFSVEAGTAIPFGEFADKSLKLESGYANPGRLIRVAFSYEVAPFLGLLFQYNNISNPFNAEDYKQDLQPINRNVNITSFQSENWRLNGLYGGLTVPFKMYRTTFDNYVSVGFAKGVLPEQNIKFNLISTGRSYHQRQLNTNAFGPSFQAGIKVRYSPFDRKFSRSTFKNILLIAGADVFYSKLKFRDIILKDVDQNIDITLPDYTQRFQLFTFNIGIGLQFD